MIKRIGGRCDYCHRVIPRTLEVCSTCIHNMREVQKHQKLQQLRLDEYVFRNVVILDLPDSLYRD